MADDAPVTRPEFENLRQDVKALEHNHVEMRTILTQQSVTLTTIKSTLDAQAADKSASDRAIKMTVWAANTLGPSVLAAIVALTAYLRGHL